VRLWPIFLGAFSLSKTAFFRIYSSLVKACISQNDPHGGFIAKKIKKIAQTGCRIFYGRAIKELYFDKLMQSFNLHHLLNALQTSIRILTSVARL
jgi:hypothetical protein